MAGPTALRSRSISNASQKNGSNHADTIIGCPCQECKRCAVALKAVMSWRSDAWAETHFQAFMGEMRLGSAKQVHVPKYVGLIGRPSGPNPTAGVASFPDCSERTFVHIASGAFRDCLRAEVGVTAAGKSADRGSENRVLSSEWQLFFHDDSESLCVMPRALVTGHFAGGCLRDANPRP
jgi:hypothetical protein